MALPSNLSVASTIYDFDYAGRVIDNVEFTVSRAIYFDATEPIAFITFGNGDTAIFYNLPRGKVYPFRCKRIVYVSGLNKAIALY